MESVKSQSPLKKKGGILLFYLIPFCCLTAWLGGVVAQGGLFVKGYYMIHYLYTYKHGFVARGFVGQVLSLFFDKVDDTILRSVNIFFAFLLVSAASLCIGKLLTRVCTDKTLFFFAVVTVFFICLSPPAFRIYFADSKIDKFLWALTLISVFAASNKISIWLVPFLCLIAVLANPVFVFCSMILIAIILLQKAFDAHFQAKSIFLCLITYLPIIFVCLYGYFSLQNLGFPDEKALLDFYFSRYAGAPQKIATENFVTEWLIDYFSPTSGVFLKGIEIYFLKWHNGIFFFFDLLFIAVPCYSLLGIFWIRVIKNEPARIQKCLYFLCMVSPIVTVVPHLLSWEGSKYFGNNILVQLCLILYYLAVKAPAVTQTVKAFFAFLKSHTVHTCALLVYITLLLIPVD